MRKSAKFLPRYGSVMLLQVIFTVSDQSILHLAREAEINNSLEN